MVLWFSSTRYVGSCFTLYGLVVPDTLVFHLLSPLLSIPGRWHFVCFTHRFVCTYLTTANYKKPERTPGCTDVVRYKERHATHAEELQIIFIGFPVVPNLLFIHTVALRYSCWLQSMFSSVINILYYSVFSIPSCISQPQFSLGRYLVGHLLIYTTLPRLAMR